MKPITVMNPDARLRGVMVDVRETYVRTCHSSTCNCASHDGGYSEVSGLVPDELTTKVVGNSVHSHGWTIRTDDEVGQAQAAWADAQRIVGWASPASGCSRAGARYYDEACADEARAARVYTLTLQGVRLDAARQQARAEAEAAAKAARKAKRAATIAAMEAGGMTPDEARAAYGIGQWSNEIDWPAVRRAIEAAGWAKAHRDLSEAAGARSGAIVRQWAAGYLPASSHPRMTAWAGYACRIFFGGALPAEGRDVPTSGNGWRLVNIKTDCAFT